ncbi:MAG: hypothetical protein COB34_01570 [Methylophilaceae bacterium]|nr:MAG: hypothetical protein COB34_01570 [Methylophilaceae bacterium]
MMQNSPLLVAQTSPAKNATTSNPSQQANEQGESFKQVLSKQVEQEEAQPNKVKDKLSGTKLNDEDKQVSLNDKPIVIDAKEDVKEEAQVSLIVPENESAEKSLVDAQLLASTETAKTVHDVTDGKVVLDVAQEIEAAKRSVANLTPIVQPNVIQETAKLASISKIGAESEKTTALAKHAPASLTAKEFVEDDAPLAKGSLKADHLVENDRSVNHKLANYLAGDKNARTSQESTTSQTIAGLTDTASISTVSLQTAPKVTSLSPAAVQPAGFSNVINTPPGKAGWSEAIGQKVVWMVGAAEQSATLTLNPKNLGPLQVIIHVNNEKADATFISENPEVRKALEEGMSGLRQSMGQAGVELGQANVNTSKQHQEFQQASKEYSARQANGDNASEGTDNPSNMLPNTRVSNGLVDTFV